MGGEIHDRFPHQLASIKYLTGSRSRIRFLFHHHQNYDAASPNETGLLANSDLEVKASRLIPNAFGQRRKTSKP